ncbi:MAG: aspartate 1-decarboxylase [Deltaproteobacteria bacterium]
MHRTMLKSKIHRATVTDAQLYYEGSIALDAKLLEAADILPGERVEVLNLNNGARIETYAIPAAAGSGEVCLNGPAARTGCKGDEVIILTYALCEEKEARQIKPRTIHVTRDNKVKD